MNRQEMAEKLKWLAVEIELSRPNWPDVLRIGIDLIRKARPLAESQYTEHLGKLCMRCGTPLQP